MKSKSRNVNAPGKSGRNSPAKSHGGNVNTGKAGAVPGARRSAVRGRFSALPAPKAYGSSVSHISTVPPIKIHQDRDMDAGWLFRDLANLPRSTAIPPRSTVDDQIPRDLLNKEQENRENQQAIHLLEENSMHGAAQSLRAACLHFDHGMYQHVLSDDIMAVDSIVGDIRGKGGTLDKGLEALLNMGVFADPCIKKMAEQVYIYSNQVPCVRHANPKSKVKFGKEEALLMHRMCVSICAYLVSKKPRRTN